MKELNLLFPTIPRFSIFDRQKSRNNRFENTWNILDEYEPMYFQIDCFHFFGDPKLKSLVSLERGDSVLSYREVIKKLPGKNFFGLRVVAPF